MWQRCNVAAALSVLVFTGCGSSSAPDAALEQDFLHGISQIRSTNDYRKLRAQVARTITRLRRDHATSASSRRARQLAVEGFGWTLRGIDSRIDFVENDSGNVEAATRDANRADRSLRRGARVLRAAGRILGVRVGRLNGL